MFNLQLFADGAAAKTAIDGKKIIYLFRILKNAATKDAVAMAFTTENERSKTKESDSVATKDGEIVIPGEVETEISSTAILAKDDPLAEEIEDAMDNNDVIEIWEANLEAPGKTDGTFKGRYFQGYLTEFTLATSAEDHAEYECTFAINGAGVKGDVTVTAEQQAVAAYVFTDTKKTGA
jgi:TP901-1 family phage major tail protein